MSRTAGLRRPGTEPDRAARRAAVGGKARRLRALNLHPPDGIDELFDAVAAIRALAAVTEHRRRRDDRVRAVLEQSLDGAFDVLGTDNVAMADNHLK